MSTGTVIEDVLDDALLLGSLAAGIFVKNPAHQTQAGNVISAVAQLIQVIDGQLNSSSSSTASTSTGTTSSTSSSVTPAPTTSTVAIS